MRAVDFLVVHHTASPKTTTVDEIRRWHRARGFSDIGYHAIIYGDGSLHRGRPERLTGAHAKGANVRSLGVTVCGNFENEQLEDLQRKRLVRILTHWCYAYGIATNRIFGHRDVGSTRTACPGNNLYNALPSIRSDVQSLLNTVCVDPGWTP